MGDVHALPGHSIPVPDGEPNPEIVAQLEDLLEEARNGRIRAIAWTVYKQDDKVSFGWLAGDFGFQIGSALALLNHKYCADYPGL